MMRLKSGYCTHIECFGKPETLIQNVSRMLCIKHNKKRLKEVKLKIYHPIAARPSMKKKFHKKHNFGKVDRKDKTERQKLVRDCDRVVSLYVRAIYPKCYTCGNPTEQCGHYMVRKHMATRFELDNLRGQCKGCNEILGGAILRFRSRLIIDLGLERVLEIEKLARTEKHFTNDELKELSDKFTKKIAELTN